MLNAQGRLNLAQIRAVLTAAKSVGVNADVMLARLGLDPRIMTEPDARVPLDTMRQLWHELLRETGRPDLALQLSCGVHPSAYGILGNLVMACATLGESLSMLQRYFSLLTDDGLFEVRRSRGAVRLVLTLAPVEDQVVWRCAVEWSVGSFLACLRALTAEPLRPLALEFQHPAPEHAASYREVFQCPIRFGTQHNALILHEGDLARPVRSADRGLQPLLQERAEDQSRARRESASMAERVRVFLRTSNPGRTPDVREAAHVLGVSVRTLARRLAAEESSFQVLLDAHRQQLCCRMLSQLAYTIEEIALVAGYSELSTFHRAFKRWTHKTPARFRLEATGRKNYGDPNPL
jgi:AraC-like DNA-binding protein